MAAGASGIGYRLAKAACALALCMALTDKALADEPIKGDWANLAAYRLANHEVAATGMDSRRVVFIGDSITEFWDKGRAGFFSGPHYVNRGISGQTTPQMLVRFRQDVIALRPRAVVILAGTNDIAGNTGPSSDEEIEGNIASMVELARAHRIRVVLATLVPAGRYPWAPQADPANRIWRINAWIRGFAQERHIALADFYTPMATPDGALRADLGDDGVHPNAAGYAVMEAVLRPLLKRVVR